jgi:hypothetical protein
VQPPRDTCAGASAAAARDRRAGRETQKARGDPDLRILESLPLVRHLPLLQEGGSVKFLQSLSAHRNQQPLRMPPEMLRDEGREFDAAVADREADHAWGTVARPLIDERRAIHRIERTSSSSILRAGSNGDHGFANGWVSGGAFRQESKAAPCRQGCRSPRASSGQRRTDRTEATPSRTVRG